MLEKWENYEIQYYEMYGFMKLKARLYFNSMSTILLLFECKNMKLSRVRHSFSKEYSFDLYYRLEIPEV